jgi:hypothetical protein
MCAALVLALPSTSLAEEQSVQYTDIEPRPPISPVSPTTKDEPPKRVKSADQGPNAESLEAKRFEVAGFPIIGGNTDIGVQFGAAATFTQFQDDVKPYYWNLDAVASASVKSDQNGFRLVQQQHVLRLDAPDLWHDRLRIDSRASFQRTINAGYFGIGNATVATPAPGETETGRRYQYTHQEGRLRTIARIHTGTPFDVGLGLNLRYISPEIFANSKLDEDTGGQNGPPVIGARPTFLTGLTAGLMYDTRDTEFVTSRGVFYQLGVGATVGSSEQVAYGHASIVLAHYAQIWGPFIFASRFVTSLQFGGNIPFYDLQEGGAFELQNLFGGENGVRGVPDGRYAGRAKALQNTELRYVTPRFRFLGQRLRSGTQLFFDAGRVWNDYKPDPGKDGLTLGMKYGIGVGAFLQWGEAAIFRIEAAYSPDATSENPGFPIGIYVGDGLMF